MGQREEGGRVEGGENGGARGVDGAAEGGAMGENGRRRLFLSVSLKKTRLGHRFLFFLFFRSYAEFVQPGK